MKFAAAVFQEMIGIVSSVSSTAGSFFTEQGLVNEDFVQKFSEAQDEELLDATISELKEGNISSKEIKLSNGEEITIVVD